MGKRSRRVAAVLCGVGFALAACGGRVDPGTDGGASSSSSSGSGSGSGGTTGSGGSGSGGAGSSSGVVVPPCPDDPPAPGAACMAPGQQGCAYFANQGCEAFICSDSSVWESTPEGC